MQSVASCQAVLGVHYACLHIVVVRCKYLDESSPDVEGGLPEVGLGNRGAGHPSAQINTANVEHVHYFSLCVQSQQWRIVQQLHTSKLILLNILTGEIKW